MTVRPRTALRPWPTLALGAAFLALLGGAGLGLDGDLFGAGVMMLGAAAAALSWWLLRLPDSLRGLAAAAWALNAASIAWNWYATWSPFDEWAHLLNPVILVAASMVWLRRAGIVGDPRPGAVLAAATVYGVALALGWEVIETWFWAYPFADTFTDVALGVVGATAGGWLALRAEPTP